MNIRPISTVVRNIVGEGVGYYFLRETKNNLVFQSMPSKYCKIVGKNNIGYEYAMDMSYFNGKESQLGNYPLEIRNAYKKYKKSKNSNARFKKFNKQLHQFNLMKTAVAIPPFSTIFVFSYLALKI